MSNLSYPRLINKMVDGEKIEYGIIYGNNKIVFIKVGADGNIRGYQDKYLKMAHSVHNRIGATVICASNPYIEFGHIDADRSIISTIVQDCRFADYEVRFVGTSDGAYHNLLLAKEISQTTKLIGINTSTFGFPDLKNRLFEIPNVKKILVYGERDDEYMYVPSLNELKLTNLQVVSVKGADHEFTGMVDKFISFIDLI